MKRLAYISLVALTVTFASCEKQVITPNTSEELDENAVWNDNLHEAEEDVFSHADATSSDSNARSLRDDENTTTENGDDEIQNHDIVDPDEEEEATVNRKKSNNN